MSLERVFVMKKVIAPLVGVVAIGAAILDAYLLFFKPPAVKKSNMNTQMKEASDVATSSSEQEVGIGNLEDGVYTGQVVSTNRGDYQIQMTVSNGEMSNIDVITYPQDNPNSLAINENALPQYTNQALEKQSSQVDLVSGASEAFKGFTGSLQDAINQAKS